MSNSFMEANTEIGGYVSEIRDLYSKIGNEIASTLLKKADDLSTSEIRTELGRMLTNVPVAARGDVLEFAFVAILKNKGLGKKKNGRGGSKSSDFGSFGGRF